MKVWTAERISHSHWSQGWRSLQYVCLYVCAGHWGSLLTFDPSLDHLTLAWPRCLAQTAEQRVLMAQAADWWFSSLLLAKSLDLCLSATGLSRVSQPGQLNMTIMSKILGNWIMWGLWWSLFAFLMSSCSGSHHVWSYSTVQYKRYNN